MKLIKTAFLIALFNFVAVGAVVMALKKPEPQIETVAVATSMVIPTTPAAKPTTKPKRTKLVAIDPFAAILAQTQPTSPVVSQPGGATAMTQPTPTAVQSGGQAITDSRCIISIDGSRYDVTVFRNIHSGGNIFQCGADMSAIFHGQHPDSYLQRIAQYRI